METSWKPGTQVLWATAHRGRLAFLALGLCAFSPGAGPGPVLAQDHVGCPPDSQTALWQPRSLYEATATFENGAAFAIREHLGAVLERLESRDVSALSAELREKRRMQIERLSAYRDQGVFPRNDDRPGLAPVFIDEQGRSCAVAYLMIESGSRELAERVAGIQNNAYVPEITVPGVLQWIEESGLDAEECAMIQPSYFPGPFQVGGLPPPAAWRLPLVFGPGGHRFINGTTVIDVLVRFQVGLRDPRMLLIGPDGDLFISRWGSDAILRLDPTGTLLGVYLSHARWSGIRGFHWPFPSEPEQESTASREPAGCGVARRGDDAC